MLKFLIMYNNNKFFSHEKNTAEPNATRNVKISQHFKIFLMVSTPMVCKNKEKLYDHINRRYKGSWHPPAFWVSTKVIDSSDTIS